MRIDNSSGPTPTRATITVLIAFLMAIWAINFIIGKIALRYLHPLTLASFRVVLAGVFMLALYPICLRLPIFSEAIRLNQKAHPRKTARDFRIFAYLGFFGVAVNQICFTVGLRYTSVTHSSIIVGLAPIYTLALAVLFRLENATIRKAVGMTVALAGVVLMATAPHLSRSTPTLLGDAIIMCGSIGFAMYVVLGKRVARSYDALTMTTYNFLFGALLALPIAISRAISLGSWQNWRAVPWPAWAGLFYMALFSSTLAYLFYYWLLRYLEASQLAAFSYLLPVSATLLGVLFLGERGSWLELAGATLALAGLYYIESARGR